MKTATMAFFLIAALVAAPTGAAAARAAPGLGRRALLGGLLRPTLTGTDVQDTNEYSRYSTASDSVLANDAQAQVNVGATGSRPIITTALTTKRMSQMDSNTRGAIAANNLQGMIESAAGGSAQGVPQAASAALNVVSYGSGKPLNAATSSARANTDAQRAIQANLNNPAAATEGGSRAAYAASFPASHQWDN